jgi:hypothetical protein
VKLLPNKIQKYYLETVISIFTQSQEYFNQIKQQRSKNGMRKFKKIYKLLEDIAN